MGAPKYGFNLSKTKKSLLDKWLLGVKDFYGERFVSLGDNFLWEYLMFQTNRYIDSEVQMETFSWIFGNKAMTRWFERSEHWRWGTSQGFGTGRFNIYESDFYEYINEIKVPTAKKALEDHYEEIRAKQNLSFCVLRTPLYNVLSISCIRCPWKEDCKKIKQHREKNN